MYIQFFGATQEVTGSCYLIKVGDNKILVECGLVQGSYNHENHNYDTFPFDIESIDAVILTHAHLDHSGKVPLLYKRGYRGPVYTHNATVDLCNILFQDAGYLNERSAFRQNKKRQRNGQSPIEPLYTKSEGLLTLDLFKGLTYKTPAEILPSIKLTLHDAGHILGSSIVELELTENNKTRTIVFSGDLGHKDAPILKDPTVVESADLVVMESTYGDRNHRSWKETWDEMGEIISSAKHGKGNILIPAFAVGRTQELLYVFKRNYNDWMIKNWNIFLDSPMAIKATDVYAKHHLVYDQDAAAVRQNDGTLFGLSNLHFSQSTESSMKINQIKSGAIVIAGSGMCNGGRIKHHFEHNISRKHAHILIVGFQARGTLGRALVDGTKKVNLWGKSFPVRARIHTVGGLSAHADQQGLIDWYSGFKNKPKVALVHGEPDAMSSLAIKLTEEKNAEVLRVSYKEKIEL